MCVALVAGGAGYYAGGRQLLAPPYTMASADCATFSQTGKQVCGRFLEYWQANGGLAQQGLPLSNVFNEVSAVDQKTYQVQYFERAVFELHPENAPPYDVLLSLLGREKYLAKYPAGEPSASASPSAAPFARHTVADVAAAFRAAGLSVEGLRDGVRGPTEPWPNVQSAWQSVGTATVSVDLRGGQILTYASAADLAAMQAYLAGLPANYQVYSYVHANVLVYLNPIVPKAEAERYKAALEALH